MGRLFLQGSWRTTTVSQKTKRTLKKPSRMSILLWIPPRCLISNIQRMSPFPNPNSFLQFNSPVMGNSSGNFAGFPQIPSAVEDLFNSEACNNITSQVFTCHLKIILLFLYWRCFWDICFIVLFVYQTPSFWVMLRAVKEFAFREGNGSLPVRGTIPDMIADSQKFINLQNV